MTSIYVPSPIIQVRNLGKYYGNFDPAMIERTGPEHGTARDHVTASIVAAWGVDFDVAAGEALVEFPTQNQ